MSPLSPSLGPSPTVLGAATHPSAAFMHTAPALAFPSAASPCDRPFIAVAIKEKTKVSAGCARATDGPRLHPRPCMVQDSGAAALGAGCVSTRLGSEFPCEALAAF